MRPRNSSAEDRPTTTNGDEQWTRFNEAAEFFRGRPMDIVTGAGVCAVLQ